VWWTSPLSVIDPARCGGYGPPIAEHLTLHLRNPCYAPTVSTPLDHVVTRRLHDVVHDRLAVEPVLILQGPRAVGKSTLLNGLASSLDRGVTDLDDLATRDAVSADPGLFVGGPSPVLIDEFQHVPEVLDAIKAELNRDLRPGRFVITGSTNYASLPEAARRLTGRALRVDVLPLTQGEIDETHEDFAAILMQDPRSLIGRDSANSRDEYVARVVAGGLPMALRRAGASRARWFDEYVSLVIERDVMQLSRVRQRQLLPRLLTQFASQTGQVLNIAQAASALGIDRSTAEDYTKLLEAVFLARRLPAWGTTLGSRVGAAPKVHIVDSGLAARMLRQTEAKLRAASASAVTEFGHLLETFVVGEISKQLGWLDEPVVFGHWRTRDGDEVDLVVEREDGKVVAIEAKAGSRVQRKHLGGVMKLRSRLGSQFLGGVVLYTGVRSYSLEEDVHILPIDRLWAA
jgi:uncharacterized protein